MMRKFLSLKAQSKTQTAQMVEDEVQEKTSVTQIPEDEVRQKTQTAQIDETVESEEPTSVFTHATPVGNPWESMGNQRDSCYYLVKQCMQRVSPSVILQHVLVYLRKQYVTY